MTTPEPPATDESAPSSTPGPDLERVGVVGDGGCGGGHRRPRRAAWRRREPDRRGVGRERDPAELGHRLPQKDMMYQQVLTDGVRIVLELEGRRYPYHAGGGFGSSYCATPARLAGE